MWWKKILANYSSYSKSRKGMWKYLLMLLPYFLVLVLLVIVPLITIIVFSFSPDANGDVHIGKFFTDGVTLERFGLTIGITLLTTTICVLVGFPAAWIMRGMGSVGRFVIIGLLTIPMWINMILRLKALNTIFLSDGLVEIIFKLFDSTKEFDFRSTWPIEVLAYVFIFIPFMILPIYNHIKKIDMTLADASKDLGASKILTFFKVIFPLSYGSIHTGIVLVFLQTATAITVSPILTDGKVLTIGSRITRLYAEQKEYAAAISVISLILLFLMLSINTLINRKFRPKLAKKTIHFDDFLDEKGIGV